MDFRVCAQCGKEIEGEGIFFHKRYFCSDECCDEYEELLLEDVDPVPEDLAMDDDEDLEDPTLEAGVDLDDLEDLEDLDGLDLDDDF